ncbi:hypothetical protein RCL1_008220 [Eukaryota sp. TZLM3-RCL]
MPNGNRTLKSAPPSAPIVPPALAVNAKVVLAENHSTMVSSKAPSVVEPAPKIFALKNISHKGTVLPTVSCYNREEKSIMTPKSTFKYNVTEKINSDLTKLKKHNTNIGFYGFVRALDVICRSCAVPSSFVHQFFVYSL